MELIYDSLLEKDENGLIPWLAKEWEVSEMENFYIYFGRWCKCMMEKFNSEDVAFTVEYFKKHLPVRGGLMLNGEYLMDSVFC